MEKKSESLDGEFVVWWAIVDACSMPFFRMHR
jgi:hypothetical protein